MANWTRTRRADVIVSLVRESGSWSGTTSDPHPPVGNEEGSTRLAVVEFHVPEPDWPAGGKLQSALGSFREYGGSAHPDYRGSNARASVERINEKPNRHQPSSTGGEAKTFGFDGAESPSLIDMVEEMMPARILRRDGTPGGNRPWGWFQVRSADEDNDERSFVLTDDIYLTFEVKPIAPEQPEVLSIVGAQLDDDGAVETSPVIVATADGQTLEVNAAFRTTAAGQYATKGEVALLGLGATDEAPTPLIRTSGSIPVTPGGAPGVYRLKLTGVPQGSEGLARVRFTSNKGAQGPWSSVDDSLAHVQLAVLPGAPLDIVFQQTTDDPTIGFSLNSPDPTDYITGGRAVVTFLPDGAPQWDSGMVPLGDGSSRRGVIPYTGPSLPDGQRVSFVVYTRNRRQVVSRPSAPQTQTQHESTGPTVTPAPGRLLTRRPTFTLSSTGVIDGYLLKLVDPNDDTRILWATGSPAGTVTTVTDQASVDVQVPADILTWGQAFDVIASIVPNGAGVTLAAESQPQRYSIANLPVTALSVPAAVGGKVGTTTPEWQRTVADPDGAAIAAIDQEIRAAATPQGTGALITRYHDPAATPLLAIPATVVSYESAVDSRARATNDIAALATTTLNGALSVGATGCTLTSATGFAVGQDIVIASSTAGNTEVRPIATLVGTAVTFTEPLAHAHANGQAVTARAFGPWSPWITVAALQPPQVDLLTPSDDEVVADPTTRLTWVTTAHGGRAQASAEVVITDADGSALATLPVIGTVGEVGVPAYLLESGLEYSWWVAATDSGGMVTTSAARSFTTLFADPVPVDALSAAADPESGTVVLAWADGAEPYLDHYEVTWLADDGSPVRLDGGPESLLDGNPPFAGVSLQHLGARLGDNVYHVAVSNGWRASEPVSAVATLVQPDVARGFWEAVADDLFIPLRVIGTPRENGQDIERLEPPGGRPVEIQHGLSARRLSMQVDIRPATDGALSTVLRGLMADPLRGRRATPVWIKAPEGWRWDPMWMTLQSFTDSPGQGGRMAIAIEWAELGEAVHAILPPVTPPALLEPDAVIDADEYDFGDVEV